MTHEQFERMRRAAVELLALGRQGATVDPLALDWARHIAASAYVGPPARVAFQQHKIVRAMRDHPLEGMTAPQICAASGLDRRACGVTLCYMAKHRQIAVLKIPCRSRYFANSAALEQGRALVEAAERGRAEAKVRPKKRRARPPREPGDADEPSLDQGQRPRQTLSKPVPRPRATPQRRRASGVGASPHHEQGVYVDAMLPAGVHIQHLAHGLDLRLVPQPPIDGIGAVDEWARLTRRSRSASRAVRK